MFLFYFKKSVKKRISTPDAAHQVGPVPRHLPAVPTNTQIIAAHIGMGPTTISSTTL
jgi:hypothetical protein